MRDRDRPHRSVEVPPFVSFALRRRLHARQAPQRAEQPHRAGDREIGHRVHLLQPPRRQWRAPRQAGDIQHREGDDFSPCRRVTHAAIERVRAILGEADDVGRGSHPGRRPRRPAMAVPTSTTPSHVMRSSIEAAFEQIEGQRAGRDEEDENPDRPVIEPVMKLVSVSDFTVGVALDIEGVCLTSCHL